MPTRKVTQRRTSYQGCTVVMCMLAYDAGTEEDLQHDPRLLAIHDHLRHSQLRGYNIVAVHLALSPALQEQHGTWRHFIDYDLIIDGPASADFRGVYRLDLGFPVVIQAVGPAPDSDNAYVPAKHPQVRDIWPTSEKDFSFYKFMQQNQVKAIKEAQNG